MNHIVFPFWLISTTFQTSHLNHKCLKFMICLLQSGDPWNQSEPDSLILVHAAAGPIGLGCSTGCCSAACSLTRHEGIPNWLGLHDRPRRCMNSLQWLSRAHKVEAMCFSWHLALKEQGRATQCNVYVMIFKIAFWH